MPLRPIEWVCFPTVKFQPEKSAVGRSCLPTGRDTFSLVPAGSLLGNAARMPWIGSFRLAVAIGLAYFLTARFSVGLVLEPSGVAVFWPAAGISSGLLITIGPHARWPVLAGVMVATIATHLIINDPLWAGVTLGLSNGAEALITAGLIRHHFGADFNLVRLRHIVGLLAAAAAATTVSGIGGAVTYRLMRGPSAPMLDSWQHWFASDFVGIITVAPLVVGLAAVVRRPSPRS